MQIASFYSKLVRLKGWTVTFAIFSLWEFLFQTGSIKRYKLYNPQQILYGFYSKLVRLKEDILNVGGDVLKAVSIPNWFD